MAWIQAHNFFAVLRAACGGPCSPLQEPDWDQLVEWAKTQSLEAVFYMGACRYREFSHWDATGRTQLQLQTIQQVGAQAQRTQYFLQIYEAMTQAGLTPLVLKGIVCRQLFGPLADYRISGDEDVYLPVCQISAACQVLKQNEFTMENHADSVEAADSLQEIAFTSNDGMFRLELHPTLFGTSRPLIRNFTNYFAAPEQRAISLTVEGMTIQTLDYTDHYLYLFFHLVKHFAGSGVGIRQAWDLALFGQAYNSCIHWNLVYSAIRQLSSFKLYCDVLEIGRRLGVDLPLPGKLFDPDALIADSLAGGVFGLRTPERVNSRRYSLSAQQGGRLEQIRWILFPSVQQVIEGYPFLQNRPWLLPAVWVRRWTNAVRGGYGKGYQTAQKRLRLLRGYGIVPDGRLWTRRREGES